MHMGAVGACVYMRMCMCVHELTRVCMHVHGCSVHVVCPHVYVCACHVYVYMCVHACMWVSVHPAHSRVGVQPQPLFIPDAHSGSFLLSC